MGFEKTIALVQNDSLLDKTQLPPDMNIGAVRRQCSFGNLTFGNYSEASLTSTESTKRSLPATPEISCLSCSVLEDTAISTPRSRLSLSDPVLEQIRQRVLRSEPVFVFCKDCKCAQGSNLPPLDETAVEHLIDFSAAKQVPKGPCLSVEQLYQLRDEHKKRMEEPIPKIVQFPEAKSPRFLFENWKEQ